MSCRVLGRSGGVHVPQALFRNCPVTTTAEADAPEPDAGGAPSNPPEHIAELHNRIMDLERTLQAKVLQAKEAGFQEGEKAGREHAASEVKPALERLSKSLVDLASLRSRVRRESEADLVVLAIAIARRILRREISLEPEAIHGVVKAALDKAQTRDICRIRIHPAHAAGVRKNLELAGVAAPVDADASLQLGDVVVETKRGDLDASIETQLQEIERGFADRLKQTN